VSHKTHDSFYYFSGTINSSKETICVNNSFYNGYTYATIFDNYKAITIASYKQLGGYNSLYLLPKDDVFLLHREQFEPFSFCANYDTIFQFKVTSNLFTIDLGEDTLKIGRAISRFKTKYAQSYQTGKSSAELTIPLNFSSNEYYISYSLLKINCNRSKKITAIQYKSILEHQKIK
jgi:hypothetical protein